MQSLSHILFTFFSILFAAHCQSDESKSAGAQMQTVDENKIRHGKPLTSIVKYPFMATVWQNDRKLCTASIVSPNYILSAGHCFVKMSEENYIILVGTVNAKLEKGNGQQFKVEKAHVYSETVFGQDIAIVKLKNSIDFSDNATQPITLSRRSNFTKTDLAFIAGWGRITDWSSPVTLQGANVLIWPKDEARCDGIMESEVCAFGEDGANVCFGDSGGPLLVKSYDGQRWEQIGVTSRGNFVCESNGFFSCVYIYCEWLAKITEGEVQCLNNE
uniref:Serine proteinase n=1 Tax=Heterodera glycines TaxID=51029 RepID=O18459_HETGL|nr:serine proteinase [Heterodera glycines]